MAGMRGRVELLSKEQEQLALSRLVGQTAPQVKSPHFHAVLDSLSEPLLVVLRQSKPRRTCLEPRSR